MRPFLLAAAAALVLGLLAGCSQSPSTLSSPSPSPSAADPQAGVFHVDGVLAAADGPQGT